MIHRERAPFSPPLLDDLAALMDRAYAPTGLRPWSASEIGAMADGPGATLLVARDEAAVLTGFLLASVLPDVGEILALATSPDRMRRGIATALVWRLIGNCKREGVGRLILEVATTNAPAISFYENLTFSEVGIRRDYYRMKGNSVDARLMEKRCL